MLRPIAASERTRNGIIIVFEQELVAGGGNDHEGDRENQRDADPVLADREDRHVGGVGRLELAGLAVEHLTAPSASPLGSSETAWLSSRR